MDPSSEEKYILEKNQLVSGMTVFEDQVVNEK